MGRKLSCLWCSNYSLPFFWESSRSHLYHEHDFHTTPVFGAAICSAAHRSRVCSPRKLQEVWTPGKRVPEIGLQFSLLLLKRPRLEEPKEAGPRAGTLDLRAVRPPSTPNSDRLDSGFPPSGPGKIKNQQTSHHAKMGTEVTDDGNSHTSEHLVWKWNVIRKAPSDPKWTAFRELEGTWGSFSYQAGDSVCKKCNFMMCLPCYSKPSFGQVRNCLCP